MQIFSMEIYGEITMEFHRNWCLNPPWNSMENFPWKSMKFHGIPWRFFTWVMYLSAASSRTTEYTINPLICRTRKSIKNILKQWYMKHSWKHELWKCETCQRNKLNWIHSHCFLLVIKKVTLLGNRMFLPFQRALMFFIPKFPRQGGAKNGHQARGRGECD